MLLLMVELLDGMLELLLVSAEDAWLDVDALPELPLPPQALNNVSNRGIQSVVNRTQLGFSVHDIRRLQVGCLPILTTLSLEVNSLPGARTNSQVNR